MKTSSLILVVLLALPACRRDSPEQVMLRARMLVGLLVEGEFGRVGPRLSPGLRRSLPPAELSQMWRDIRAAAGRVQRIGSIRQEASSAGARAVVSLQGEKRSVDLVIVFNHDGKATQLSVKGLPKPLPGRGAKAARPAPPGKATPPTSPGTATPPASPGKATPPASPGKTTPPASPGKATPPKKTAPR